MLSVTLSFARRGPEQPDVTRLSSPWGASSATSGSWRPELPQSSGSHDRLSRTMMTLATIMSGKLTGNPYISRSLSPRNPGSEGTTGFAGVTGTFHVLPVSATINPPVNQATSGNELGTFTGTRRLATCSGQYRATEEIPWREHGAGRLLLSVADTAHNYGNSASLYGRNDTRRFSARSWGVAIAGKCPPVSYSSHDTMLK